MSIEITMPRLSDTMEQGTIIRWMVKEGDAVSSGDAIADVETDKATMEMQVYDDGIIAKILIGEGQTVEVGTLIAVVAEEDENLSDIAAGAAKEISPANSSKDTPEIEQAAAETKQATSIQAPQSAAAAQGNGNGRTRISPVARRLAEDHGVDASSIQGSGPAGRIVKRDILRAVEAGVETAAAIPPSAKPVVPVTPVSMETQIIELPTILEDRAIPLSNMRQIIAKRLVESKTSIPHYQVTVVFDMDPLLDLRKTLNQQLSDQGVKLSVNDFLVRCCALAMYEHPEFNASWGGDHIQIHGQVNIGVAISLPAERGGGLVVATIYNSDQKSLRAISADTKTLAEKARTRGLTVDEMSNATFTISNLGMFGVEHFTAIINPPNSAILAIGAALQKPVVRDGVLAVGHEMSATLSLDHRVIDGATAAKFLQTLKRVIENPATLLV